MFSTKVKKSVLFGLVLMVSAGWVFAQDSALYDAIDRGNLQAMRDARSRGGDPNRMFVRGGTAISPLYLAVEKGNRTMVTDLLSWAANPNQENTATVTPLALALNNKNTDIAEILIKGGANVNAKGKNGMTPLMSALLSKDAGTVKFLFDTAPKYGQTIDVNVQDTDGNAAIHYAVTGGDFASYGATGSNINLVEAVLKAGKIDINQQGAGGNTPLLLAVFANRTDMVNYLLGNSAIDLKIYNRDGFTPLGYLLNAMNSGKPINDVILRRLLALRATYDQAWNPINNTNYLIQLCADGNATLLNKYLEWVQTPAEKDMAAKLDENRLPLLLRGIQEGWSPQVIEALVEHSPQWESLYNSTGKKNADDYVKDYKRDRMYGRILDENRQ
jgi:ankyrin repeat protein